MDFGSFPVWGYFKTINSHIFSWWNAWRIVSFTVTNTLCDRTNLKKAALYKTNIICLPVGLVRAFNVLMCWCALWLPTSTISVPGPSDARMNKYTLGNKWGGLELLVLKPGHGFYLLLTCCAGLGQSFALSELPFAHLENTSWEIVTP